MKRLSLVLILTLAWCGCSSQRPGATTERTTPPPAVEPPNPNAKELAEVRAMVKGRESEPAEKVFKNIKILTGVPAGRIAAIMDIGYSRSLGVRCTYCHEGQWDYDTLPPKNIAREMALFNRKINRDLLPAIPGMETRKAVVNCTTCHRGSVKPALDMEPAPPPTR